MADDLVTINPPRADRFRTLPSLLWRGCVVGGLLAVGLHFGYVLVGSNFRTVLPGQLYRCAQPSARQLERIIRDHGIRTVVNLRGTCISADWYRDQARITGERGVSLEDLGFSAGRLPSTVALRQLIEVLDKSTYPVLLHCHQGADRTGLATVVFFLLRPGMSLSEARKNLGVSSGHLALGRTAYIDLFFNLYEEWLAAKGLAHSESVFRLWADNGYCPAEGRADFCVLDSQGIPVSRLRLRGGQRRLVTVRCKNTSIRPWQLQPGPNAGIHATWMVVDGEERPVDGGRAGLFDARIMPGEYIDLTIPLSALPAGRFQLRLDLFSAQHGSFLQLGNDPLLLDVEVS